MRMRKHWFELRFESQLAQLIKMANSRANLTIQELIADLRWRMVRLRFAVSYTYKDISATWVSILPLSSVQ